MEGLEGQRGALQIKALNPKVHIVMKYIYTFMKYIKDHIVCVIVTMGGVLLYFPLEQIS